MAELPPSKLESIICISNFVLGPSTNLARKWPKISSHAGHIVTHHVLGGMPQRVPCVLGVASMQQCVPHHCCSSLPRVLHPRSLGEAEAELPFSSSPFPHLSVVLLRSSALGRRSRARLPWLPASRAAALLLPPLNRLCPNQELRGILSMP
jgi:hypothetical protein